MKIFTFWKPILIATVIFYGSLSSGSNFDKISILHISNIDKCIHFFLYFFLSISLLSSLFRNSLVSNKYQIPITLIIVISYGIIMEIFQFYFTVNRSAELFDALANTLGCICGTLIFPFLKKQKFIKYL